MNYKVQESISNITEYKNLLLQDQSTLFYQSIPYHNLLKEHLNCESVYFLAYEDDKLVGILPFLYKESEYGSIFNSLPYYGSNGAFIIDKTLDSSQQKEIKKELYNQYLEFAKSKNVLSSTIITNPLKNDKEFIENELKLKATDYRIGQITKLPENTTDVETILMSKFQNPRPRNIRRAIKANIEIKKENNKESIDFLYTVHRENIESIGGKAKEKIFFDSIPLYFKNNEYSVYIAYLDEKPIAGLLLFYYNKTVEYFTPATLHEYRNDQPSALIIYQAMLDAIKMEYEYWNWGGTWESQKGVYDFKSKWNAKDFNYYYYTNLFDERIKNIDKLELLKSFPYFYIYNFIK